MNLIGLRDVLASFKNIQLPLYLAYSDIRQRYRRSVLGPFWITLSTAIMICCIGVIFSRIYKSPASFFFPYLAVGFIFWAFIIGVLKEATVVFSSYEAIIKQLDIPLCSHLLRAITKNVYILLHNLIILPFLYLFVGKGLNPNIFYIIPGFFLLLCNLFWMALFLSIICARFRDVAQIVASILQVFFYITPIMWMPSLLKERAASLYIDWNPFYHLVTLVRNPFLGDSVPLLSLAYSSLLLIIGGSFTILFYGKYRFRIPFWL